jgi:hypothetical protein
MSPEAPPRRDVRGTRTVSEPCRSGQVSHAQLGSVGPAQNAGELPTHCRHGLDPEWHAPRPGRAAADEGEHDSDQHGEPDRAGGAVPAHPPTSRAAWRLPPRPATDPDTLLADVRRGKDTGRGAGFSRTRGRPTGTRRAPGAVTETGSATGPRHAHGYRSATPTAARIPTAAAAAARPPRPAGPPAPAAPGARR